MYEDKIDEVVELLKEAYDTDSSIVNEIIEMVMDVFLKIIPQTILVLLLKLRV